MCVNSNKKIACFIMASGNSKRFGKNKLLAAFDDKPLLKYIIDLTTSIEELDVYVITKHPQVKNLCKDYNNITLLIHNKEHRNEAIAYGLSQINVCLYSGFMFCNGDQPLLSAASINNLVKAFEKASNKICRLAYDIIPGNPVIFPAGFYDELCHLPMKVGGSYIIKKHPHQVLLVPSENAYELKDIDTPSQLEELILLRKKYVK